MHPDELDIDVGLVHHLLRSQLPHWSDLPIAPVTSTGTANAMYRLGEDMVVRLPRQPSSTEAVEREHRWLPVLAPHLSVAIPVPLALGSATARYPMPWSVYPWFDGEDATTAAFDPQPAATDLARFIAERTSIDPTDGPLPVPAAYGRGGPLADRDHYARRAIAAASHLVDTHSVTAAWEQALAAPAWNRPGVWVHGDIASGNVLFRHGRLAAVIDFSALSVGDPACDLAVAWEMFDGPERQHLRRQLAVDDATWARARGWALSTAALALSYYEHTNQFMADQARHKLAQVLS